MFVKRKKKEMKRFLIALIVLFCALPSMSVAEEGWIRKADMPTARYGLSANVVGGNIYAIGGRAGGQFFSIVEVYDPVTDSWKRKANMPTPRTNLSASVVNGKIFVLGGVGGAGIGPTAIVEEYDPTTDTWARKADMPTERFGLSTSVVNGKIYAFGGNPVGVPWGSPILEEYDPVTDTWARKAIMPTPRSGQSTSAVDGKIYVIGGTTARSDFGNLGTKGGMTLSIVEEYDPATDTWTEKADMPTARSELSTCVVNGKIYAIGGIDDTDVILSVVEVYDPATDTWAEIPDLQVQRYNLSTCTINGKIYAIGGQPGAWPTVTGAVEVYSAGSWEFAANPSPADGALHLDTWVALNWTAGDFAASHDVYFSDNFEDVNTGIAEAFCGNQSETYFVAGFAGFAYPEGLVRGMTYYWQIDEINDLHPDSPWKGKVWRFTIPSKKAYDPFPSDGAESVDPNVELSWTAGFEATVHTVYFGDSFDGVDNATEGIRQAATTYVPGPLKPGKTCYWRVDEFSGKRGDETYKGDTWSFTTGDYVVIDDFEDYAVGNNEIWWAWKDGVGYSHPTEPPYAGNGTGSIVGDESTGSYMEETIVHGGRQSMPVFYDNNQQGKLCYSEVEKALTFPRDWTEKGVGVLSLWFRGYPASVGSFTEGPAGTYTMTGAGVTLPGSTSEEFHFAYQVLSGVGSIVARIDSLQYTHPSARAGVMIRETLSPDSVYAFGRINADPAFATEGRSSTGSTGFVTYQRGPTPPHWVKVERNIIGNLEVSHSTDGSNWEFVPNPMLVNIPLNINVSAGLAVSSQCSGYPCEAAFSNVTFTGDVSPQWMNEDIGILSNDPEPLYVAIANTGGTPAVVYHENPNIVTKDTWTQWTIDLSAFADQGVDLADVDRIAIGLGTEGNDTTPGGSGKMYFDDIRLYRPRNVHNE